MSHDVNLIEWVSARETPDVGQTYIRKLEPKEKKLKKKKVKDYNFTVTKGECSLTYSVKSLGSN